MKAFYKMLLCILAICICFWGIGSFSNRYSEKELEEKVMDSLEEKTNVWKKSLEQQMDSLLLAQSNLVSDQNVLKINVFLEQMDSYDRVETVTALSNRLREIKLLHNIVSEIKIYFQEQKVVVGNTYPILEEYEEDEFYQYKQLERLENGTIIMTIYFPFRVQDTAKRKSAYYARSFITPENLKVQLSAGVQGSEGILAIFTENGELIVHSDIEEERRASFEQMLESTKSELRKEQTADIFRIRGNEVAVCTYSTKMNMWILYSYPETWIEEPLSFFRWLNILLAVLTVLLFLAYVGYSAKTLARPLNTIMTAMEKQGDSFLIQEEKQDEFSFIYSRYNQMILKTNKLMHEKLEAQYQNRMSQLRQLQYQIQPHFLYNSIFTVYRMAQMDENEQISEYTKHLGQYYQYITKSSDRMVNVSQEIEYLRNYLYIQETRFGNRICVVMREVSDEILSLEIAPLLLQPLVENAYEHGLSEMVSGGVITISAEYENRYFIFRVEDNGCGVAQEELERIRENLNKEELNDDVIHGLMNINKRVHLLYEKDSGLFVSRREAGGFCVELKLYLPESDKQR